MNIKNYQKVFIFYFFLFSCLFSSAQNFIWDAGFNGFFDNREYFNSYTNDQTIFGSRIFADAGFEIDEKNSFSAGLNYLYEFGSKGNLIAPDLTLYYTYKNDFTFNIGAFPRKNINLPLLLLTDKINYYRPNIEGMFFEFRRKWGYQNIWIDWTGRQAPDRKESIMIGGSGRFQKNIFFYEHHFSFFHDALPANSTVNDHIQDNGGIIAMLGIDLSKYMFFDTLTVSSGLALSYDRLRNVYDVSTPTGWYSNINVNYKGVGINSDLYWGESQNLLNGDRFYRYKSYQRFNLYYLSQGNSAVKAKIEFSVHITPGNTDYSQLLAIYIDLGGRKMLKNKF